MVPTVFGNNSQKRRLYTVGSHLRDTVLIRTSPKMLGTGWTCSAAHSAAVAVERHVQWNVCCGTVIVSPLVYLTHFLTLHISKRPQVNHDDGQSCLCYDNGRLFRLLARTQLCRKRQENTIYIQHRRSWESSLHKTGPVVVYIYIRPTHHQSRSTSCSSL